MFFEKVFFQDFQSALVKVQWFAAYVVEQVEVSVHFPDCQRFTHSQSEVFEYVLVAAILTMTAREIVSRHRTTCLSLTDVRSATTMRTEHIVSELVKIQQIHLSTLHIKRTKYSQRFAFRSRSRASTLLKPVFYLPNCFMPRQLQRESQWQYERLVSTRSQIYSLQPS